MEDFFCVLKPGKFQANWDKLVTYRVVGRGKERMHEKHPVWGLANGGGGWGLVFAACQLMRPLCSAISQTSQQSCLLSLYMRKPRPERTGSISGVRQGGHRTRLG